MEKEKKSFTIVTPQKTFTFTGVLTNVLKDHYDHVVLTQITSLDNTDGDIFDHCMEDVTITSNDDKSYTMTTTKDYKDVGIFGLVSFIYDDAKTLHTLLSEHYDGQLICHNCSPILFLQCHEECDLGDLKYEAFALTAYDQGDERK